MTGIEKIVGADGIAIATHNSQFGVTGVRIATGEKLWTLGKEGPRHLGGKLYFTPPSRVWIADRRVGNDSREGVWSVDAFTGEIFESEHTPCFYVVGVLDGEYVLCGFGGHKSVSIKAPEEAKVKFNKWLHPPFHIGADMSLITVPIEDRRAYRRAFVCNATGVPIGLLDEGLRALAFCETLAVFQPNPRSEPTDHLAAYSPDAKKLWEQTGNLAAVEGVSTLRCQKTIWSRESKALVFAFRTTVPESMSREIDNHDGMALCCREMDTGEVRWAREFNSMSYRFDVLGTGGLLWVALGKNKRERPPFVDYEGVIENEPGRLLALDVKTGETVWEKRLNAKKLMVVDGKLVVSTGGALVCLGSMVEQE